MTHGGSPTSGPAGFAAWETVALLCVLVGLICLGIAVMRAGTLPRWVGALLSASAVLSFVVSGRPGPPAELGDDCLMVALIAIGWQVAAPAVSRAAVARTARAS